MEPTLVRQPLAPLERTLELRAQLLVPPGRLEQRFRSAPLPLAVQSLVKRLERRVEGPKRMTLGRGVVLLDSLPQVGRLGRQLEPTQLDRQLELPQLGRLLELPRP